MHENREISGASRLDKGRDRSEKAQSHNADMHVPEKSDCAVVPMNQPNKGEQSYSDCGPPLGAAVDQRRGRVDTPRPRFRPGRPLGGKPSLFGCNVAFTATAYSNNHL